VPEWQSSHPSNENRIAAIKREMPEALQYYNAYKAANTQATTTTKKATTTTTKKAATTTKSSGKGFKIGG
jgi:predicted Zn-dependent protease